MNQRYLQEDMKKMIKFSKIQKTIDLLTKYDSVYNADFYDFYLKTLFDHFNETIKKSTVMMKNDPNCENLQQAIQNN